MDITAAHVALTALVLGGLAGAYWLGTRSRGGALGTDGAEAATLPPRATHTANAPPPVTTASMAPSQNRPAPPRIEPGPLKPTPVSPPADHDRAGISLPTAKSWGYQLQNLKIATAVASPFDLLVIDTTRDGDEATALTPADLARLKMKPDGARRTVLAYLSIGEAESYRPYWNTAWKRTKPAWLLGENPEWEGNYSVCFWDPAWQALIYGSAAAALDRVIEAGFDGVYLDKCDVYEDLREHFRAVAKARPHMEADMVAFVGRLSAYAKAKRPSFQVVMQNAEELVERAGLLAAIDGIAKEELIFGMDNPEKKNSAEDIKDATACLLKAQRAGKAVFCVEYLNTPAKISEARAQIGSHGFVLYIAAKNRELDRLNVS